MTYRSLTLQERDEAYHAQRIIRAKPGGATHKKLLNSATPRILRLVEIMPAFVAVECIAVAEQRALDQLNEECGE